MKPDPEAGVTCKSEGPTPRAVLKAKATRTPKPDLARPIASLAGNIRAREVRSCVVHGGAGGATALSPGVKAVGVDGLPDFLEAR
jgi:hypothetical protein